MRRRTLLCACGIALSGFAGCSSNTGEEGKETTEHPTETPEPTVVADPTTIPTGPISLLALQPALVKIDTDVARFSGGNSTQYLYLHFEFTDKKPPAHEDLTFQFDGESHEPIAKTHSILNSYGAQYTRRRGKGWVLFELPASGDGNNAGLCWPNGEWTPSSQLQNRLAMPHPSLSADVSIEETIAPGSVPTITVEVTNEGSIAGRFVGALSRSGPEATAMPVGEVTELVPAGESKTIEVTESNESFDVSADQRNDGERDLSYEFTYDGNKITQSVRITTDN
ncbi:COG1361 family protein [Halocatena halophila]|uniref:hypothetical protein n=1 Tax=Halocatena halophila TaxID=2814576 RepID=UPI002ED4D9EB